MSSITSEVEAFDSEATCRLLYFRSCCYTVRYVEPEVLDMVIQPGTTENSYIPVYTIRRRQVLLRLNRDDEWSAGS